MKDTDSTAKPELMLQLVRRVLYDSTAPRQPLHVETQRERFDHYMGAGGYLSHNEYTDITLTALLTYVVQALEKLGVEFNILPPVQARPASVQVKVKE
jgi:hypothetical protein